MTKENAREIYRGQIQICARKSQSGIQVIYIYLRTCQLQA